MKFFLQKSLSNVLLLVVLFFGGCSTINNALDIVKDVRTGIYYTSADNTQTFTIEECGLIYTQNDGSGNEEYKIGLASSGSDYIEYVGTDNSGNYVRVVLSDITDSNGGTRTEYDSYDDEYEYESGFTWYKKSE